jgi:hypothetical protein
MFGNGGAAFASQPRDVIDPLLCRHGPRTVYAAGAFVPWPGFCRVIERLRDAVAACRGQVRLAREWYQPQLGRL